MQVQKLESAAADIGKTILPQHLLLVANCLSATGEFVSLNAKGIAQQLEHASVTSPFMQACFSVSYQLIFVLQYVFGSYFLSTYLCAYSGGIWFRLLVLAWLKLLRLEWWIISRGVWMHWHGEIRHPWEVVDTLKLYILARYIL